MTDPSNSWPVAVQKAVDQMNAAFLADPVAVYSLFEIRVPCNETLADHPFVVVSDMPVAPKRSPVVSGSLARVGVLGFVNCALTSATGYRIVSLWSEPVDEEGNRALVGFTAKKAL